MQHIQKQQAWEAGAMLWSKYQNPAAKSVMASSTSHLPSLYVLNVNGHQDTPLAHVFIVLISRR